MKKGKGVGKKRTRVKNGARNGLPSGRWMEGVIRRAKGAEESRARGR